MGSCQVSCSVLEEHSEWWLTVSVIVLLADSIRNFIRRMMVLLVGGR